MLLNIFSLKISITKQKIPHQTAIHNAQAKKLLEDTHQKAAEHTRMRPY